VEHYGGEKGRRKEGRPSKEGRKEGGRLTRKNR